MTKHGILAAEIKQSGIELSEVEGRLYICASEEDKQIVTDIVATLSKTEDPNKTLQHLAGIKGAKAIHFAVACSLLSDGINRGQVLAKVVLARLEELSVLMEKLPFETGTLPPTPR